MRTAKAVVAAIGSTLTALTSALATVTLVLDDDAVDLNEISSLITAVVVLGATVWAVWRVPNEGYVQVGELDKTGTQYRRKM